MKYILSLMLLIASVSLVQAAFITDVQVQEALNPPDTFMVMSAISAPIMAFEFIYEASPVVTPLVNKLSHLNSYTFNNTSDAISEESLLTLVCHFREVETVPKFPTLIRQNRN